MNNSEELTFENISVHLDLYVLMEVISGDPSVACISNKERLSCVSELINQAFQQKSKNEIGYCCILKYISSITKWTKSDTLNHKAAIFI